MERAKIIGMTKGNGICPDLIIKMVKSGVELTIDPFVSCALLLPEDLTNYREYIENNYVGKFIDIDIDNILIYSIRNVLLPSEKEIKLL